jgi:isopentenyl-diphosphate delta-isomerase
LNNDPTSSERKKDHIDLAFKSQIGLDAIDSRFYYEPMLAAHPDGSLKPIDFLGKNLNAPLWVSSMTGGTEKANRINTNLAKACKEFGLGMGLGSCRSILDSDERLRDFDLRNIIGEQPFYANLGIAQIETLIENNKIHKISELVDKLNADGLIVHVNPMQEWLQAEGDRIKKPPIETIKTLIDKLDLKLIVKEVGQGFGYNSMRELMHLPLEAIEFAAHGGTNFAKLELLRNQNAIFQSYEKLAFTGHGAGEMVEMVNNIQEESTSKIKCKQIIISGGIKHFIDGYYYINKIKLPAIYGQASSFLAFAQNDYEELHTFIETQIEGLKMCNAFLRLK